MLPVDMRMLRCGVSRFVDREGVMLPDLLLLTLLEDLALARPLLLGKLSPNACSCSASPTCACCDASAANSCNSESRSQALSCLASLPGFPLTVLSDLTATLPV